MSPPGLDPIIHAPLRLQICAILAQAEVVDFATVRELLDVSDSVLSKHVKVLDEARYVDVLKKTTEGRVRTSLALSASGRRAFQTHARALRTLVGDAGTRAAG